MSPAFSYAFQPVVAVVVVSTSVRVGCSQLYNNRSTNMGHQRRFQSLENVWNFTLTTSCKWSTCTAQLQKISFRSRVKLPQLMYCRSSLSFTLHMIWFSIALGMFLFYTHILDSWDSIFCLLASPLKSKICYLMNPRYERDIICISVKNKEMTKINLQIKFHNIPGVSGC